MQFVDVNQHLQDHYRIAEPGDYVFFLCNTSGTFTFEVAAENVNLKILGVYVGHESDDFHLRTIQHHASPRSTSELFIKGVFFEKSRFDYSGLIQIDKNAQQTDAVQTNRNLMMSKQCVVKSEPQLEILADDVKCAHASTTGKLNPEQVYYLMTRGVPEERAKQILAEGFVADVFAKVRDLGFGDHVEQYQEDIKKAVVDVYSK